MRHIVFAFLVVAACSPAEAVVVQTTNLQFGGPFSGSINNYAATVWQDPGHTDWTGAGFQFDGLRLSLQFINTDEGSDWYFSAPGRVFGPDTVGTFNRVPGLPGTQIPLGSELYLAVSTSIGSVNRTHFGWLHLFNDDGVLKFVDSAMAYNTPGIIVGTINEVPEPMAIELIAAGIAACAIAWLRSWMADRVAPLNFARTS